MIPLDQWKAARHKALTAPDGWLNLADRLEYATLPQTIGSAPDNDLCLANGPAYLGSLLDGSFQTPDGTLHPSVRWAGFGVF